MQRWLVRIFVFLLLGAIVNVAVAWGIALRRGDMVIERNRQGCFVVWDRPWQVVEERPLGMVEVWWYDLLDVQNPRPSNDPEAVVADYIARRTERQAKGQLMPSGRPVVSLEHLPRWGTFRAGAPPEAVMGADTAFGLPLRCLWMCALSDLAVNRTTNERLHGGWLIGGAPSSRGNQFTALPLRPLWPGFAINTVFYALILWLLFAGPFVLRRWRRIRRGLCPKCAYDLRGTPDSAPCPECGARRSNS